MAKVADFLVERLRTWGVKRIYGYPGDGINGVLAALDRAQDSIRFVQARHEEMAAFMACGHAKYTGEVGVCLATSGPGAIHLLNGLYDAKADRQPVVAIVGQRPRTVLGGNYQQEVDLVSLFKDVCGEYLQMVTAPAQLRHVIDRAFRAAASMRTPTCIVLPADVQTLAYESPPHAHYSVHTSAGYTAPRTVPVAAELIRAAEILNAGERVALLVGAGALGAEAQVLETAELLGAGIAKALLGKSVVPDDEPFVTGTIGFLGTRPSYRMMSECDTLLVVGSSFPYAEFLPEEGQARAVQIDLDPRMIGLRYPMEVSLVGDSAETLKLLNPLLRRKASRGWRESIEKDVRDWWGKLEERAGVEAEPLNPQRVFWELSARLPSNALLATDTGTAVFWFARDVRVRPEMLSAHSGSLASMGAAMPYAIAAKMAYPERPLIAMIGDGAMQMNGINELITVGRYWREWRDPRFVVLVLNNRDLNFVTWEQRVLQGARKFSASQDLPQLSYSAFARLLGIEGIEVSSPEHVGAAWDRALSADRPVLIEAMVDPNVPLLPPHITMEQARHYIAALAKGDPDAAKVLKASLKEVFA